MDLVIDQYKSNWNFFFFSASVSMQSNIYFVRPHLLFRLLISFLPQRSTLLEAPIASGAFVHRSAGSPMSRDRWGEVVGIL